MKWLLGNHRCQTPQYSGLDSNRLLDNILFKNKPKILYPPSIIVQWKWFILKCHHCTKKNYRCYTVSCFLYLAVEANYLDCLVLYSIFNFRLLIILIIFLRLKMYYLIEENQFLICNDYFLICFLIHVSDFSSGISWYVFFSICYELNFRFWSLFTMQHIANRWRFLYRPI